MDEKRKYEIIKSVIDKNDPMNLLSMGFPYDEYSQEVSLIEAALRNKEISQTSLTNIISEIFFKQFDERLNGSVCKKIAKEIEELLSV